MLSAKTQKAIIDCARAFDVETIWLFGSALGDEETARDIDLAVEGIESSKFFKFYGELFFCLTKPVDLVDLSLNQPINHLIRADGVKIYERGN